MAVSDCSRRAAPRAGRIPKTVVAFAAAVVLAVVTVGPAAARAQLAGTMSGEATLTLAVANCQRFADAAVAVELARHVPDAAAACIGADGVPDDLAALVAEFAPDHVLVVGGDAVVGPSAFETLTAAARSASGAAVVKRLAGDTRSGTAAAAARFTLGAPDAAASGPAALIVADGWNEAEISLAREFAATLEAAAVVYGTATQAGGGLSAATIALISDYRPARVIFVGAADESARAAEATAAAALRGAGSVDRVANAAAAAPSGIDVASLTSDARATFAVINAGERLSSKPDGGAEAPLLALVRSSGVRGVDETLFTVRADGSRRIRRAAGHQGWAWNRADGRLGWATAGVWVAAPDGQSHLLAEMGVSPSWSPDGSRFVSFVVDDLDGDSYADRAEAFVAGADGSQRRSLGFVNPRTWLHAHRDGAMWSADGRHLAYSVGSADHAAREEFGQVRMERADAGAPPVTIADDAISLRWSPQGSRLLFLTRYECGGNAGGNTWELWVAEVGAGEPRRIGPIWYPELTLVDLNPWSPDGVHVAYEALDPRDCSTELRVASVESDAEPVTIESGAKFLGWSPDGAYVEYGTKTERTIFDHLLPERSWIARRDGSSKRSIGELTPSVLGWVLWSHDGTHIAYTRLLRDAHGREAGLIAQVERADGTAEPTVLAQLGHALAWSPDGRLAYAEVHDDDGNGVPDRSSLRVHAADPSVAADATLVHALPGETRVAIWSPDASHLIYVSGTIESLTEWIAGGGVGADVWSIAASEPRWTYRLVTDVTWGEWQP